MSVQAEDCRKRFLDAPLRRTAAELYCLALVFWFHNGNSHGRKAATIIVVLVWAMLEVGAAYGAASLPDQFFYIRVFVGVLIGRMWGIQINNFAGIEFAHDTGGEDEANE